MRTLFLAFSLAGLAGCATTSGPAASFQLANGSDGHVYRTNNATGETWRLEGERLIPVHEEKGIQLSIGQTYYIERNRSVTYLGDGKFSEPKSDYSQLWK